jgi:hypothetical protein
MSSDVSTGQEDTRDEEGIMRRLILQTGISIDGYVAALACPIDPHPRKRPSVDDRTVGTIRRRHDMATLDGHRLHQA